MNEAVINPELLAVVNRVMKAQRRLVQTGKTNRALLDNGGNYVPFVQKNEMEELEKFGIYKRYWNCTFSEIEKAGIPNQVNAEYVEIKRYAATLKENIQSGRGLILKGPVGTMKTSMAVAVLREQLKSGNGLFIPMVSLLDTIFTIKERNKEEWVRFEEKIRNTGLLVLDDLGAECHQEWVLSKVDAIISERYNRMKSIIITTNLSNSDLNGKYAERIIDRLGSTAKVINFKGKSLRVAAS